jgi:hypothetical protein
VKKKKIKGEEGTASMGKRERRKRKTERKSNQKLAGERESAGSPPSLAVTLRTPAPSSFAGSISESLSPALSVSLFRPFLSL